MAELNFDQPQGDEPDEQPDEQPEDQPEPEPEPQAQEEPDRLSKLEDAVSQLVDWARNSAPQAQSAAPAAATPARKRPDFGDNPVANVLYDEIQSLREEFKQPWQRLEQQKAENDAINEAYASLQDDANRYIQSRASDGDPKVKPEELANMLISMGQLRDKRIPIAMALKNAYNAVAYDQMKENVRNNTFNEVRKPGARIPAEYRPGQRRPQMQQAQGPRPGESKTNRLKREMDQTDAALARMTPDELADQFGG